MTQETKYEVSNGGGGCLGLFTGIALIIVSIGFVLWILGVTINDLK